MWFPKVPKPLCVLGEARIGFWQSSLSLKERSLSKAFSSSLFSITLLKRLENWKTAITGTVICKKRTIPQCWGPYAQNIKYWNKSRGGKIRAVGICSFFFYKRKKKSPHRFSRFSFRPINPNRPSGTLRTLLNCQLVRVRLIFKT